MVTLNMNLAEIKSVPTGGGGKHPDVIPEGLYQGKVIDSEMKPVTNGHQLVLKIEVIDGEFKGKWVWHNLNIINTKYPKAEAIANSQLKQLGEALGITLLQESAQLHDKPFIMKLGIKEGTNGYADKNEPKGYMPIQAQQATPVVAQQPQQKNVQADPWAKPEAA